MGDKVTTAVVTGEPVPESAYDVALLGTPSLVTLKHDIEGEQMKLRILRACGHWVEGDQPDVNAQYGRQLIGNGLAEGVIPGVLRSACTGET